MKKSVFVKSDLESSNYPPKWNAFWSKVDLLPVIQFLLIVGLYAYLVVYDTVPKIGLIFLAFLWLIYLVLSAGVHSISPMNLPILALIGLLPMSLVITIDRNLTLSKLFGLILGIALFYVIVIVIRNLRRMQLALVALLALAYITPLLGFISADWSGSSYVLPQKIFRLLPMDISIIHNLSSSGGIHVNTIGGVLTFFVPLLVSLLWDGGAFKRAFLRDRKNSFVFLVVYKSLTFAALIIVIAVLFLTQSRGAYLGSAIGILGLAIWKDRRFLWVIPFLLLGLLILFIIFANGDLQQLIAMLDTNPQDDTLPSRFAYWKNTVYLLQDFPFSGTGLGTYGKVFQEFYVYLPHFSQLNNSFYAHNLFLALAADMGLPTLMLYISFMSIIVTMISTVFLHSRSIVRVTMSGLTCGVLAHLIYGIFDNFMLGEKLGIIMWIFFGLITALFVHNENLFHFRNPQPEQHSHMKISKSTWQKLLNHIKDLFLGLTAWVIFSLMAISFINLNPYISLILTILGGIILGVFFTRLFYVHLEKDSLIENKSGLNLKINEKINLTIS